MNWTRRDLLKAAMAFPAGLYLARYEALAAPLKGKVKITNIKTMQLRHNGGDCLIKIETDAGLVGYGEAGGTGAIVRSRLQNMQWMLIGQDPLQIERHFHNMSTMTHTYIVHIPTVSGVDIALWDLAGKILGEPVYMLLGGRSATGSLCTPMTSRRTSSTLRSFAISRRRTCRTPTTGPSSRRCSIMPTCSTRTGGVPAP